MSGKTNQGHFFEDYHVGLKLNHATPRTVHDGDAAMYQALYGSRFAMQSSWDFASPQSSLRNPVMDDLLVFHTVFGKTVPDVSLNAVANLGYAECRFLSSVESGDTIQAYSEVIGVKENSNGKTGIVWVRTKGFANVDRPVLEYVRWVMVKKRDAASPTPETVVPDLAKVVAPDALSVPAGLDWTRYDYTAAGEPHRLRDYTVGEVIDHVDGVTLTDAEHMMATRLWQNTAKVHFDVTAREGGKRLIYGGHIMSMARALSFNGLANAQLIAAINGGAHANPAFAGDTVRAWSEVLDTTPTNAPGVGAIRLRLVATKGGPAGALRGEDGKYLPDVLLDLDYWALMPV
ncbi:MaoC family dehydratase [Octadecabacter sp. G9-8]|uniref:MaoC family dehydratase n=1 Tax=Octadecabacter dasysiphoniae TaxID=2909341 RepID=A0ABS9CQY5_9RHOB|nr:MaoC family dehydratase [Octadecabacter dasysiphoniae]MCF2869593.1 MaoC family dehydratase [Octadecabacter dasysiphoniae]